MRHDLGYIDLEQKTLQTIDNPFSTRVTYVLGTFRYPCLRVGQKDNWRWTQSGANLSLMKFPVK